MPFGGTTSEQDKKIDSCISQISGTNKKTGKPFTPSEKVAVCKAQVMGVKSYFFTNLEYKSSEDGDFYIEGIASSINEDLGNDTVTGECLEQMSEMINDGNIKLGFDHTEMLGGQLNAEAVGRLFEAKVKDGHLWVKGILDKTFKHFDEIKHKIQNKFLDGLSIEYSVDPEKTMTDFKNGDRFRVIGGLKKLLRVALTPTPMNTDALFDYQIKHLADEVKSDHGSEEPDKQKKKKVKKKMTDDQNKEEGKEEKKGAEEGKSAGEEGKKAEGDAGADPSSEEKKAEESKGEGAAEGSGDGEGKSVDFEALGKKVYEKKQEEAKNTKLAEMTSKLIKTEIKKIQEPYLNPAGKFSDPEKSPFDAELKNWRKTVQDPKADIELKYQSAAELHNRLIPSGITRRTGGMVESKKFKVGGTAMQDIQISGFEYKAQLEHDTNKVLDTDYYQNAAELADVYDPVIVSHLNDKTTLWGLMRKKNVSNIGSDRYGFKFWRTRIPGIGGTTSDYNYDEGDTLTGLRAQMTKAQIPFMQYGVVVQVSGLTVAEARGTTGDIFSKQVQRATTDLLRGINADLFGTAVGMTDGGKILGLEVLGDDGGTYANLYGHARSTFTTLQGTDDAQSNTPNIDKPLLRKMIRTPEKNGAPVDQMIYVCDPIQRDKILGLLDPAQRFNNTSARAGFEGMPMFDSHPIHADDQCNDGYIYALPMGPEGYYASVLIAPTFEDLAKTDDSKKGFVKTYFAVLCEHPNWVYKVTGLNTT